jgi:hypothetical protein
MKTVQLSLFSLCMLVLTMVSCQKDELIHPQSPLAPPQNKDAATCATQCIVEGGPYFETTDTVTVKWGGACQCNNTKKGIFKVYNTTTHLVFVVRSTVAIADLIFDGVSTGLGAPANTDLTYAVPLPSGWQACDIHTHQLRLSGHGPQIIYNSTYYLVGICPSCQYEGTALNGVITNATDLGDGWWRFTVAYTFSTEEAQTGVKTQGGLTAGGNQGVRNVVASPGATIRYTNNNAVLSWVDDFAECSSKTYTVTFERVFSGSGVITGTWSSKLPDGTLLGSQDPLVY